MDKSFTKQELYILKRTLKDKLDHYELNPDNEDADTVGAEIEYCDRMLYCVDVINDIIDPILACERSDASYILGLLYDLNRGIPLTDLGSYEEHPEEWEEVNNTCINQRYKALTRRTINLEDGKTKDIYTDYGRFEILNIIDNQRCYNVWHLLGLDKRSGSSLLIFLDQLLPIEFPYNIREDKIKIYVELFDCKLQENAEPVKTLGITHFMTTVDNSPNKIMRFFDVTNGNFEEIDLRIFATRRQAYEHSLEKKSEE